MLAYALLVLASAPAQPLPTESLVQCLAHLSNAPEYASIGSDTLGNDEGFLRAAIDGYCSDEASPLWRVAHARARDELGLPAEGRPAMGQQSIARREMYLIVGEMWSLASTFRTHPLPLTEEKMSEMAISYLLEDKDGRVSQIIEGPLTCVGKGARAGQAHFRRNGVEPSRALAVSCGYQGVVEDLVSLLRVRFPGANADFASKAARSFLEQAAVWASLSR